MNQRMHGRIAIPMKRDTIFYNLIDIMYFEKMGNNTPVYTRFEETHIANKKFEENEVIMMQHKFIKVNESILINMEHVKTYKQLENNTVVMNNDDELIVSAQKRRDFENAYKSCF